MSHGIAWTMIKGNQRRSYAVVGSTIYRWYEEPFASKAFYAMPDTAHLMAQSWVELDERAGYTMIGKPRHLHMGDYHFAVTAVDKCRDEDDTRSAVGALISIILLEGETT